MEIHKPKLARNWREFAIEIGTIICGILIALGLDQTVEWLHRRAEVQEAREALRSEIAFNAYAAKYNLEYDRCLVALGGRIADWAKGGPRLPVGAAPTPWISPGAVNWDVVKTGAAAHMPLRERMAYARVYHDVDLVGVSQAQSGPWLQLAGAEYNKAKLSQAEAGSVLRYVAQEQLLDNAGVAANRTLLHDAKAVGVEPLPLSVNERAFLTKFCNAQGVSPQLD